MVEGGLRRGMTGRTHPTSEAGEHICRREHLSTGSRVRSAVIASAARERESVKSLEDKLSRLLRRGRSTCAADSNPQG